MLMLLFLSLLYDYPFCHIHTDYDAWRDKYPSFTNFDKEGVPIYGKDVNPDYQPLTLEERRKKDGPLRAFIAELDKKLIEAANMDD